MSEPQVTMTGPARLRALAADLELIRADMEAFDLRQLAALWEADLSYAAGLIADEILRAERAEAALDRATNDLMLSEESFVTMRAKRDEVLSELRTTRAALERARAVERQLRIASDDPRASYETSRAYERAANDLEAALGVAPVSAQTCQECGHLESEHRSVAGGLGFACRHAGCDCIKQPAPAGGEAR